MTPTEFIEELRASGVRLWMRADNLVYRGPSRVLTPGSRERLAIWKPQIREILEAEGAARSMRPMRVVQFRLRIDAAGIWHTCLGPHAGETFIDLQQRYGTRLQQARTRP